MSKNIIVTNDEVKKDYEPPVPVNGYILTLHSDAPDEHTTKAGIHLLKSEDKNDETSRLLRPYLIVQKVSPEAKEKLDLQAGDIIETETGISLPMFFGSEGEKYVLVNSKFVAAIYKKK